MAKRQDKAHIAPLETGRGEQQDDNIDDLGHRPDGTEQDQPVHPSTPDKTHPKPDKRSPTKG
ncbi:hypothetical protein [Devosia sp. XK-2]|uniref:hypothetical protein n=1 Tax=Devosia sp. XK-2 TaxID=3126689 RepID=UPI0030D247D1